MTDCELCAVSFRSAEALRDHMQQHLDLAVGGTLFECGNCRRSFFTRADLSRHGDLFHRRQ